MTLTNRTLDRLADRYKIGSDYGLAKLLNVTRGAVSNWRAEKSGMADPVALRAAQLLDDDAEELLALLQAERAPDDETKKVWRHIAGRLRRSAAVITLGIASFLGFSPAPPAHAGTAHYAETVYYGKSLVEAETPSTHA